MDRAELIKNNKLLADFTEITVREFNGLLWLVDDEEDLIDYEWAEVYSPNNDWNQLMTIVDDIEKLGYFCMINKWTSVYTGSKGDRLQITTVEGDDKLLNTY